MKKIILSNGKDFVLVDDTDYFRFFNYRWHLSQVDNCKYAIRFEYGNNSAKHFLMHREILNAAKGVFIDHKDGNGLNNQRINLRICSRSQNQWNKKLDKSNTSGFKGVFYDKNSRSKDKKWRAAIKKFSKRTYLGSFTTSEEAARVYDKAAKQHFGDFSLTNKDLGLLN